MQLGKTLVGAIIGAALGIAVMLAVYWFAGIDKMWLAIPVALLTGFGVRMTVATSGHASYLRGAITVVLALAAYLGGLTVTKAVANYRASNAAKPSVPADATEPPAGEPGDAKGPQVPTPPPETNPIKAAPQSADGRRPAMPGQISTWDFISLAIAALVAYELGRGTGMPSGTITSDRPAEPLPSNTHPDA